MLDPAVLAWLRGQTERAAIDAPERDPPAQPALAEIPFWSELIG